MAVTILFILYCFEAGVFFIFVPWTKFWSYNPLLHATPMIGMIAENYFFRGLVTGFGLVHFFVGLREIALLIISRRRSDS